MNAITAEPIITGRLLLPPLRIEHADEMARVLDDVALHTYIGGVPDDAAALRHRYQRMIAGPSEPGVTWCYWVIELSTQARLVGTVQATVADTP